MNTSERTAWEGMWGEPAVVVTLDDAIAEGALVKVCEDDAIAEGALVKVWARAEIVAPAATAAARYWRARECKVWSFQVRMRAAQSAPIMGPRPSPR
jgi:hypothetical protein